MTRAMNLYLGGVSGTQEAFNPFGDFTNLCRNKLCKRGISERGAIPAGWGGSRGSVWALIDGLERWEEPGMAE